MAVQYNKKNNTWSGLLVDIFNVKKNIIDISEEATNFFNKTKNWRKSSLIITDNKKFDSFVQKMNLADKSLINFLQDTKYGTKDLANYQLYLKNISNANSTFASLTQKAGSMLKSFGAALGSMAAMWAIGELIGLAVSSIDNLVHSAEHCKKRVDNLISSYESALNTANSNANKVEELADKYETLSKGVNNLGQNVSLTTDEYNEYNNIVNEIAEMFPALVQGYTDENNAILSLKGNVNELRDAYKEAQQEAYNMLIINGTDSDGNDIIDNYNNTISGEDSFLSHKWGNEKKINYLNELINSANSLDDFQKLFNESNDSDSFLEWAEAIMHAGLEDKKINNFTNDDLANVKKSAQILLQQYKAENNEALKNVQTLANAYLMTNGDYEQLDKGYKNAASIIINSIDENIANGFKTKEDVGIYVSNIIEQIKDNTEIQDALVGLFTTDFSNISINDAKSAIDKYIETIAELLGENPLELKTRLGFDDYDVLSQNYQTIIDEAAKQASGVTDNEMTSKTGKYNDYKKIYDELNEFATKKSINTQDEIVTFKNAIDNANGDIEKAFKNYLLSQNAYNEKPSFENAFNSADFADSKEKLLELAKSGEITADVLESTDEYKTLLTQTGLSAEGAKLKILDMLTATEKLSAASKGMESLSTAFKEWQDKGFVTAETLEALPDAFKKDTEKFDLFSQIVGDPTNSEAEIQQAFNDIATEYLKTQGTLGKITEENTESYIANLKDMGIANAEEVIEDYKTSKDEFGTLLSEAYEEWTSHLNDDEQAFNTYLSATDTKNAELMNAFGEEYSTDYQNWLDLLQKKKEAYETYRSAIEGNLVQTPDEAKDTKYAWAKTDQLMNQHLADMNYYEYEDIQDEFEKYSAKLASTKFTSNSLDYTGSKDSSSSSSSKDTSQTYDWIETKIKRLNDALDSIKTKADNVYSSWTERNTELANAISNTKKAIDLQSQAYSRYIQEANSVGLSQTYKELVEIGAIDISTISDETLKEKISDYQTWYEKAQECLKTQDDLNAELNELNTQKFDNIKSEYDAVINRMQSAYDLLESQITLLSSSGDYDTLRNEQTDIVNKLQSERNALQNNLNSSNVQQYTEQWYNLISQLDDLDSQILDAENKLKDIDNLQFDNLKEAFDFDTSVLEHGLQTIQNKIDLLELKGQFANESYYNGMIEYTQQQLDTLKNERTQLQNILNNTLYKQGTSEWNNMYSTLMDIDEEIDSMTSNLTEYNNAIRDLNWEIFEYLEESLSRITEETDYYVELLSKKHLFDENGQITNYGTTSIALHAAAYDVYKQQAQDYYEEVQDLQKQLVNGAGEEVLSQYNDMVKAHQDAVLAAEDEKQAILDLIEDGYNAQLDALQRLIDKKKEQLNAEKNLYDYQKSIAEKADNISSLEKQKLAYEGDTSEEAMSKIQQIKVQLEEAKADLKESEYEQYLSDTETMLDQLAEDYENWMNERLDHSDELIAEVIGKIALQSETINNTLKETSKYYGTFISESLNTIFNSDSPFTQSLAGGLNNVSNSLNSGLGGVSTSVAGTTTAINNLVSQVANIVYAEAAKTNAGSNVAANNNDTNDASSAGSTNNSSNPAINTPSTNISNTNKNTTTTGNSPTSNTTSSSTTSSSNTAKTDNSLLDSILINKKDYYPKGSLNIDTSVVDRLKYNDKDSSFSARATYWSKIFGGTYTGSPSQNTKLLNYLKSNGYKSGTSNAVKGNHWTQEDGGEIIYRTSDGAVLTPLGQGDMVFDNESSKRLWELANNPEAFIKKYNISSSIISAMVPQHILNSALPDFCSAGKSYSSQNMSVGDINVNMELPNVSDYKDFRNQLIGDSTFEKAMFTSINHALTGKGTPLDKLKHSR